VKKENHFPLELTDNQKEGQEEANEDQETGDKKKKKKPLTEDLAAAKIQAGYRGVQTRRELKKQREGGKEGEEGEAGEEGEEGKEGEEEEVKEGEEEEVKEGEEGEEGEEANEPEENSSETDEKMQKEEKEKVQDEDKAAAKIQAGFRGHKVRKEKKEGNLGGKDSPTRGGVEKQTSELEGGSGSQDEIVKEN